MGLIILAAIILLPLIEIAVFIQVGSAAGVVPTILMTIGTAVAGTMMLRMQGISLLRRMQSELDAGRAPGEDIMHGAMIVLASVLLLIPGFVTDFVGLLLFVPPIRAALAAFIVSRANVVTTVHGQTRTYRGGSNTVDLDEDEWQSRDPENAPSNKGGSEDQPRISPWNPNN